MQHQYCKIHREILCTITLFILFSSFIWPDKHDAIKQDSSWLFSQYTELYSWINLEYRNIFHFNFTNKNIPYIRTTTRLLTYNTCYNNSEPAPVSNWLCVSAMLAPLSACYQVWADFVRSGAFLFNWNKGKPPPPHITDSLSVFRPLFSQSVTKPILFHFWNATLYYQTSNKVSVH